MTCAFVIDVLKQLLSRQLLAAPNETYQASIVHRHLVRRATLAPKLQAQPSISNEPGVPVAKRCEPIARVFAGVRRVADADTRRIEQSDDDGKNLVTRQAG